MQFFIQASSDTLPPTQSGGPFDTIALAIEAAETHAAEILRDYKGEHAKKLRDEGFSLEIFIEDDPSFVAKPIGIELRAQYNRADWHGIARPAVHADPSDGEDASIDTAMRIIRRQHYTMVRGIAGDLLSQIAREEISDCDDFETALHETVDGCESVVYTFKAKLALLASDNETAYENEGIGGEPTTEQRAFYAITADVRARLDGTSHTDSGLGLSEDEVLALETGACDGNDFSIDNEETYPAKLADADDLRSKIVEGAARELFCCAYASAVDLARTIGDTDAPNMSGQKVEDFAPETSEAAETAAEDLIARIQIENNAATKFHDVDGSIGAFFRAKIVRQSIHCGATADVDELAKSFGHYLAMEALGHGVAWDDDSRHEAHGLEVGRIEYSEEFTFKHVGERVYPTDGEYGVGEGSDQTFSVTRDGDDVTVTVEGYA